MKSFQNQARTHCKSWVKGWNERDLDKILSHYEDKLVFISPKIGVVYPNNKKCTIVSKRKLREYFSKALVLFPKMNMEIVDFIYEKETRTAILDYWNHLKPDYSVRVMERMRFSKAGKIENVLVCYGIEMKL